jgi:hypothetical protein
MAEEAVQYARIKLRLAISSWQEMEREPETSRYEALKFAHSSSGISQNCLFGERDFWLFYSSLQLATQTMVFFGGGGSIPAMLLQSPHFPFSLSASRARQWETVSDSISARHIE